MSKLWVQIPPIPDSPYIFFYFFIWIIRVIFHVFFAYSGFFKIPDLGPNWLHLLLAVAKLIKCPKNICRWRLRPNFTGQFMRVLYHRICEQRMPRWAYTFAEYHHRLCCLNWNKKKRCRWRFRPNFVPSKAVVLLLLIHSLIFPIGL